MAQITSVEGSPTGQMGKLTDPPVGGSCSRGRKESWTADKTALWSSQGVDAHVDWIPSCASVGIRGLARLEGDNRV